MAMCRNLRSSIRLTSTLFRNIDASLACSECRRLFLTTASKPQQRSKYKPLIAAQLARSLCSKKPSNEDISPSGEKNNSVAEKKNGSPENLTSDGRDTIVKVIPRMTKGRKKIDPDEEYTGNIYVPPVRAMQEYLLESSDLDGIEKKVRRSPFPNSKTVIVYRRSDIEKKAEEIWGSKEKLEKEKQKRENRQKIDAIRDKILHKTFGRLRHREIKPKEEPFIFVPGNEPQNPKKIFQHGTGQVVMWAVSINAGNFVLKTIAWLYTGSHSMFAEAIHSAADTINQLILAYGIKESIKEPDKIHPYGYTNFRYVSSLISGVGIFCIGAGLSWYHGIQGLLHPGQPESLHWGLLLLGGTMLTEGATFIMAISQLRKDSKIQGKSFWQYVRRGEDPSSNVVLLEDFAAILGVGIAGSCMAISHFTLNPIPDAIGSLMIGCVLASVAAFIIHTNTTALVGRSIPVDKQISISDELERDRMIRALHDVKATDMGGSFVRFKAEVDFDGKEITRSYLNSQDLDVLLTEIMMIQTNEQVEAFMLLHGENVIDMLGSEIDRIERNMKKKHPEVRHVDLEVL